MVEAPVSSMNTNRQGSRSGCWTNQACRRAATSGRSCSAACAVFFEADPAALEEPPQGADAHRYAALEQQGLQLGQRHIRPLFHRAQKKASLRLDPARAAVSALRSGPDLAPIPPKTNPTNRARNTHTKTRRSLSSGGPRSNCLDNTNPKIVRKAFHHACWPPLPAHRVNHKTPQKGIPFDSISSENALTGAVPRSWSILLISLSVSPAHHDPRRLVAAMIAPRIIGHRPR